MTITSAFSTSAKSEFFSGAHSFQATVTPTASIASGSASVTAVSSMAGVAVGMAVTAANIPANTVVATITSSSAMTLSQVSTGAVSGTAISVAGDVFKIALIKTPVAGTYGAASVNYTDVTGNTDEVTGAGYSAGGVALGNVSPTTSSTTAYVNFSPNPSWTSATFSTAGCMIYNSSVRLGGTSGTNTTGGGRCVGVFDFGGPQQVSAGTLTVLMPIAAAATAIFRLA